MQGESHNLWLLHIPLHGLSIMLLNGLVTRVHSRADNIVAAATQCSVDIGESPRKKRKESQFSHPNEKLVLSGNSFGYIVEGFGR